MEKITAFKTPDGKIFTELKKAKEHVESGLCQTLDTHLMESGLLNSGRFSHSDLFKIISTIFPDYETSLSLISKLGKISGLSNLDFELSEDDDY